MVGLIDDVENCVPSFFQNEGDNIYLVGAETKNDIGGSHYLSIIHNLKKGPVKKDPKDIKYLLQDIIIIYRTIENACSKDFREHAAPIIERMMQAFMEGLHDPEKINEHYQMVFDNALIYGFEESLGEPFKKQGLDIKAIETWPVEKINWIPEELKEKLIPPIQNIFKGFRKELEIVSDSQN